jgi:hypothetical protein
MEVSRHGTCAVVRPCNAIYILQREYIAPLIEVFFSWGCIEIKKWDQRPYQWETLRFCTFILFNSKFIVIQENAYYQFGKCKALYNLATVGEKNRGGSSSSTKIIING